MKWIFSIISNVLLQNWTIRIFSFAPNFFSCYTERKAYFLIRVSIPTAPQIISFMVFFIYTMSDHFIENPCFHQTTKAGVSIQYNDPAPAHICKGERNMAENKNKSNREYKSDVFSMLMKVPKYALDAYNGMNMSAYTDPSLLEIDTLENGISLSIRNDASFLIDSHLNLYEHQSTYNPNAPLRNLFYLTNLLSRYIRERDLYGRKLCHIPTPHIVVFYNGGENRPEKEVLKLSDAFIHKTEHPDIEVTCTVYNINPGFNQDLLARSKVLSGYMYFVNCVRDYLRDQGENRDLETAIRTAIKDCIDNHILEDFFRENVEKVVKVMVLDYTWERREELIREEEYEDGKQAGIEIGKRTGIEIGTEQGTSLLEAAIEDLCAGKTITELEAAGYDQKIIQKAQNIINKHFNKK